MMEAEPEPITTPETGNKIHCKEVTSFLLAGSCAASLMHLSHDSEPYGHGAVAFLLTKSLFKTLEYTMATPPGALMQLNETGSKLAKFVPLALLNAELFRRSGLLDGWNESSFGLLLAASVPTALAVTELKESYFNRAAMVVNGANLVALGLLVTRQQNYWGAGMGLVCALDCFAAKYLSGWVRLSESNLRNLLRSCFAGLLPFYLGSL